MGITTIARDTIAGTIATTTVGKEEPGAIRAFSLPGQRAGGEGVFYGKISILDGVGDSGAAIAAMKP
jgi:hypothetical protein